MSDLDIDVDAVKEQLKNIEVEVEIPEEKVEEKKYSPIEEMALKYRWDPNGDRTAEEFIALALEQFPEKSQKIKRMQKTLDHLVEHNKQQEQAAYERAMRDLTEQRNKALQVGDHATAQAIEQEAENLKPAVQIPPEFEDFLERHSEWFNSPKYEHRQMKKWFLAEDQVLTAFNLSHEDHVRELEEGLMKQFPEYFNKSPEVKQVSPVESGYGSNVAGKKGKRSFGISDLNDEQRRIANEFAFSGVMTKEEYIKQLVQSGVLK